MKKTPMCAAFVAVLFVFGLAATAAEAHTMPNVNGFSVSHQAHLNLASLGFTEQEMRYLDATAYKANSRLRGKIAGSQTRYFLIRDVSSPQSASALPYFQELSAKAYQQELRRIQAADITGRTRHGMQTLTTTIVRLGKQRYRVKQSVVWDKPPLMRLTDVSAIGLNTAWGAVPKSEYGQQKWVERSGAVVNKKKTRVATYNTKNSRWTRQAQGYALRMNLPNDVSGGIDAKAVLSLSSYLYFEVTPIFANKRLDAYGQYAHQVVPQGAAVSIGFVGFSLSATPASAFRVHPEVHIMKKNP